MVFQVPTHKQSIKQNVFEFQLEGDKKVYTATRFDMLPTSFMESVAEIDSKHIVKALRLALAGDDEKLAAKLGELPIASIQALIQAWQESAGVSLGESEAS